MLHAGDSKYHSVRVTIPGMRTRTEPVAIAAAVQSVLVAAVAFGVNISAEQLAAVNVALMAVLGLFVRSRVTPNP